MRKRTLVLAAAGLATSAVAATPLLAARRRAATAAAVRTGGVYRATGRSRREDLLRAVRGPATATISLAVKGRRADRRAVSDAWNGKDLRRLLEALETMPPTAPKSLLGGAVRSRARLPAPPCRHARGIREHCPPSVRNSRRSCSGARAGRHGPSRPRRPRRARRLLLSGVGPTPHGRPTAETSASHRYSPRRPDHQGQLQSAGNRLATQDRLPRPAVVTPCIQRTPLLVGRTLYPTAGMRRAAIALNAATGEMLWMHAEDEGKRGQNAPRNGAGRGVAWWASATAPIGASST